MPEDTEAEDEAHSVHHVVVHVRRLACETRAYTCPVSTKGTLLASCGQLWQGGLGLAGPQRQALLSTLGLAVPKHHRKLGAPEGCEKGNAGEQVCDGQEWGVCDRARGEKGVNPFEVWLPPTFECGGDLQMRHSATVLTAPAYKSPSSIRGGAHNASLRFCETTKGETRYRMTSG